MGDLVGGNLLVRCHTSPATGEGVALRLASLALGRSGRQQRDLRKFANFDRFQEVTFIVNNEESLQGNRYGNTQ